MYLNKLSYKQLFAINALLILTTQAQNPLTDSLTMVQQPYH